MPAPMKQPHWRTRLQMVALLVNPANFFHAAAASQIAFEAIAQAHYGAVFVVADPWFASEAAQIAKLSLKYQLPSMHQLRVEAEAGGLISYGPDVTDLKALSRKRRLSTSRALPSPS
jgi:hypothetical protein